MPKLCDMEGVRGGEEGCPIELWIDDDTGRLVVVGYNQAGNDGVGIDLWDLITWLQSGPECGSDVAALRDNLGRDTPGA